MRDEGDFDIGMILGYLQQSKDGNVTWDEGVERVFNFMDKVMKEFPEKCWPFILLDGNLTTGPSTKGDVFPATRWWGTYGHGDKADYNGK